MRSPAARTGIALLCSVCLGWVAAAAAEVDSGSAERLFSFRADHMVLDAAVHGSRVLVGTQSGRVAVFDWRDGKTLAPLLTPDAEEGQVFPPSVRSVAVSPSGRLCAVVTSDGRLRLFDFDGDEPAEPSFTLERSGLLISRFLSDERLLLGDMRGELALLDLETRREVFRRQLEYDPIYALTPSPDGRRVAVAFRSSRIQILDVKNGETLQVLSGHRDSVFGVEWLSGHELASAGKDKHLYLWDLRRANPAPQVLYAGDHYITALAADARDRRLALPLDDHRVGLIRVADRRITHRLEGHTAPVQVLLFVEGGSQLISAGSDARVLVWSLADDEEGARR